MANEYQLDYTAAQINDRLGKAGRSVLFTEQTLTDAQKSQARTNIGVTGTGADGKDGTSVTVKSVSESSADGGSNVVTFSDGKTVTIKNGSKGSDGLQGEQGFNILRVTTALSSYTTTTGGFTPKYRIALSTVLSESGVSKVRVGDTILRNYYTYLVGYVDSSYVYVGAYASIRGATGAAGTTPVKGTDYFTDADKAELVEDVKNSIDGLDKLIGSGVAEATYVPNLAGYMVVSTGAMSSDTADVWHTDYIALSGYKTIKAKCNISANGYALAFFDVSKNILPTISVVGEGSSVTKTIEMEVPSNAVYCMLSDYQYGGKASDAYITLYPTNGLIDRMDSLELSMASPLKCKTIAVLGDSISSVAYTVPNYWQLIAEKTGCTFLDYGVSGSCFAKRSGSTTSFVERATNMASADAVLVMGGTNDAGKDILLGDWASTDSTTLYGALNSLISLLRSKYYDKPIIFCTPIKSMYVKDSGFPGTMADLKSASASTNVELWHCALAIQAKCAVHGIPVIDLYNASGIGSQISSFFREDDKLHPSALGECRIANMVQPVLEQQFLHTTEDVAEPGASYTNLVTTSIGTDKKVYNGNGYMDGYRLSSSGSVSSTALSTATHSGFMEFKKGDTIRVVVPAALSGSGNYFCAYDASFTFLSDESLNGFTNNQYGTTETLSDGRVLITIFTDKLGSIDNAAYFRISANPATGASLIVTVNEEITV